ncbi:hypothetical protein GOODEAATRI_025321, partial [Goodea atripinnis]
DSDQPQGLGHTEDAAEHEHMKAVLRTSLTGSDKDGVGVPGLRTRTRSRPGRGGRTMQAWTSAVEDTQACGDDAADEIMEHIVRSATQGPGTRTQPRERRRSRANRKSCFSPAATNDMTLLWGSGSPPCWRVMIALEEKKLQGYSSKLLSFEKMEHKSQEVLDINPRGQVGRNLKKSRLETRGVMFPNHTAMVAYRKPEIFPSRASV